MSLQALNVTNLPIYLPDDVAPVPFGDPFSDVTCTSASPGVLNAPGYVPTNADQVQLTVSGAGVIPTGLAAATTYFVVSANAATGNFSLSATKGGSAINTSSTGTAPITLHLLSGEKDGTLLPFKPGNTVVVLNLSGGSLTLQGANDSSTAFGNPGGPGSWNTLAVVGAGAVAAGVNLSYDWIRVSTSGTLVLLQI